MKTRTLLYPQLPAAEGRALMMRDGYLSINDNHVESFQAALKEPTNYTKKAYLFVALLSTAVTGIVVAIVGEFRARPSPMQQAALTAIFNAEEPDTIGAVVVMKNGTPEVIATVRSRDEYLELAGSGRLPEEHFVFLPDDA